MKRALFILTVIIVSLPSCHKIKYYGNKPITNVQTKILAHKGGGDSEYPGDNLRAVSFGLSKVDGIEVDIQISKNRTLWLSHTSVLPACSGSTIDCFTWASDQQIMELDSCLGNDYIYSTLDTVFYFLKTFYPEKCISIDVKAWNPCNIGQADIISIMNVMGDEIIRLVTKYSLQNHVMVESEVATFLSYVKRHSSGIGIYLGTLGDFERGIGIALENGYDGISFQYKFDEEITADHVRMMHNKGLRIHLWTLDKEEDIVEALTLNPDFIQSDNLSYFKSKSPYK
jgi:glycerophosphoryl diester phosphodiesterase